MKVLEQSNWSKKWYLKKGSVITNSNGFGSNLETIVTQEYRQEHIRYRRSDPNQPSTSSTIQQQEKPQDFELAELLFSSSTSNARDFINPSIQPKFQSVLNEADKLGFKSEEILSKLSRETKRFKSFETRFQSFVDQIPSYLHSSIKDGFFPHFFLGMFSTLLDTKLNKKLNIKRLYYGFDTAQTLKIVAVTGQDTDPNQIDKVSVFIFSEGVSASGNDGKAKFTQGEWESIKQKIQLPARLASIKPDVKVVKIAKNKIKDQDNNERTEIKIKVEDKAISQVNTSPSEFTQIVKQLHAKDSAGKDIYLEDYIAKLASPNQVEVQRVIDEKILLHIKKVHANLKLPDNVYASKAREASLHAFVTGVFVNDRYRDNTRIYLEQFAGRGYADIVLLVRGPNRAADSVPIVIELKAGTKQGTAPVDALEQAKKYTEGFQPNKMRILTTSNDVLCVGLNLDYPSDVKNALDMIDDNSISDVRLKDRLGRQIKNEDLLSIINNWNNNNRKSLRKQIEQRGFRLTFNSEIVPVAKPTAPLMKRILTDINNWDGSKNTEPALKKQLTDTISREYHTFPANKETKDTYYFSRYMLGQSILVNKLDQGDIKKYVFSYGEEPLREYKGEYSLLECPVTTLVFVQEKTAFILHMREANTKEFYYDKKIPMTGIA